MQLQAIKLSNPQFRFILFIRTLLHALVLEVPCLSPVISRERSDCRTLLSVPSALRHLQSRRITVEGFVIPWGEERFRTLPRQMSS